MLVHNLVPSLLRKARTILIFKKGAKEDPNSWRPISICSILRRIIERVLDRRLNDYIILNDNQVGFTSTPGTYLNTMILNFCLLKAKKDKLDCAVVLLDVQKAFEETSHAHLEKKLDHTLMPNDLRNLTKSLLLNNKSQIQTKIGTSSQLEIKKGVFQGLPLSPKMFNLSINHVLDAVNERDIVSRYGFEISPDVEKVTGRGFADDLALFGNSQDSALQLAKIAWNELDKVGYKLNFEKCIVINIKKGVLVSDNLKVDDNIIRAMQVGDIIKYLGVNFQDEIAFTPENIMSKFNKDLQYLISCQMLYAHQKIALINQYIWPCLIYSLQNTPLSKIPQSFLEDLDKMVRSTVKAIIGLPHDTPNSMLYAPKKVRGLQITRPSWETYLQHYNVCIAVMKSNDKYAPFCKDLEKEMRKCVEKLNLNSAELETEFRAKEKAKPTKIMREKLRHKEYENWCNLQQRGIGVKMFSECTPYNQIVMDKKGITNSEWVTSLKMNCNVVPVRSIPGRSTDTPQCRNCTERETLPHVLGSCHAGDLLRNARHHEIRSIIADHLRKENWTVQEEIHCVASNGSNRRVDIWCYKPNLNKGFILDPTVRMEMSLEQAGAVNEEKKSIYEPCIQYFRENYQIEDIEVMGLLVGARGAVTKFFEEFRRNFKLPKSLTEKVVISAIRGSCKIINNHLYKAKR
ncbi:hypothetical protein WDU94_005645 [Cyamophila willieti]